MGCGGAAMVLYAVGPTAWQLPFFLVITVGSIVATVAGTTHPTRSAHLHPYSTRTLQNHSGGMGSTAAIYDRIDDLAGDLLRNGPRRG